MHLFIFFIVIYISYASVMITVMVFLNTFFVKNFELLSCMKIEYHWYNIIVFINILFLFIQFLFKVLVILFFICLYIDISI